jgi:hypothetical protein
MVAVPIDASSAVLPMFLKEDKHKILVYTLGLVRAISQFLVEMKITLASVTGKQFIPPGVLERFLYLVHQLFSNSLILEIRMNNEPSHMASTIIKIAPFGRT